MDSLHLPNMLPARREAEEPSAEGTDAVLQQTMLLDKRRIGLLGAGGEGRPDHPATFLASAPERLSRHLYRKEVN